MLAPDRLPSWRWVHCVLSHGKSSLRLARGKGPRLTIYRPARLPTVRSDAGKSCFKPGEGVIRDISKRRGGAGPARAHRTQGLKDVYRIELAMQAEGAVRRLHHSPPDKHYDRPSAVTKAATTLPRRTGPRPRRSLEAVGCKYPITGEPGPHYVPSTGSTRRLSGDHKGGESTFSPVPPGDARELNLTMDELSVFIPLGKQSLP
jgi:hypothetical protein